jgi:hypothetical protein
VSGETITVTMSMEQWHEVRAGLEMRVVELNRRLDILGSDSDNAKYIKARLAIAKEAAELFGVTF